MRPSLAKIWWLLALCGALDAAHATLNLVPLNPSLVWDLGILALAAGACALAAGLWCAGQAHSWLLSLHGLALAAFGAIVVSPLVRGPLSFRPVSVLFAAMAASLGAFALASQRRKWLPAAAGAVLMAFALSFPVVGFGLVRLPPRAFFAWMSSYFGICAMFLLWLSYRVRGPAR